MNVNWKAQAGNELARARKSLRAAKTLLDEDLLEDAVSRAYYAVLHAAKAALAKEEMAPKTHSGVSRLGCCLEGGAQFGWRVELHGGMDQAHTLNDVA
jgi:hypothetical protein